MRIRRAIIQAALLAMIGTAAALIHNAFSANGIDPLRRLEEVPVFESDGSAGGGDGPEVTDGICVVSLEEVQKLIEEGNPVLDARTPEEYESGHIPGAMLCDYYEMARYFDRILPRIEKEERIGVYCSGPACDDSEMLARELYTLGYTKLCVFRGGIEEWTEAGLSLEFGAEKEFQE